MTPFSFQALFGIILI